MTDELNIDKFWCRRMPPEGKATTPDECAAHRARPRLGQKLTRWETDALKQAGLDPNERMPMACERCKEWEALCSQVEEKRRLAAAGQLPPAHKAQEIFEEPTGETREAAAAPAAAPVWTCAFCHTACSKPAARGLGWKCYSWLKSRGRLGEFPRTRMSGKPAPAAPQAARPGAPQPRIIADPPEGGYTQEFSLRDPAAGRQAVKQLAERIAEAIDQFVTDRSAIGG